MEKLEGYYQIWGPPGTGKTTTVARKVEQCIKSGDRILLASLTRAAAEEIRSRNLPLPPEQIGTLHAHCYRVLHRPKLTESNLGEWNTAFPQWKLSGGVDSTEASYSQKFGTVGDEIMAKIDLYRSKCIPESEWPTHIARMFRDWVDWKTKQEYYDFVDLITEGGKCVPPGAPDVFFVDEAQDISKLEIEYLIKPWSQMIRATVLVGDPYQCLYEWRGSSPQVFLNPPWHIPDDHQGVLGQRESYRCPIAIKDAAMQWIRGHSDFVNFDFKARQAPGRLVRTKYGYAQAGPKKLLREAQSHLSEGRTVMFLASCGYQLTEILAELRREGLPFWNPYAKKRGDWNPLTRKVDQVSAADRLLAYLAPLRLGRRWTYAEMAQWIKDVQSKGLLKHGAKTDAEQMGNLFPDDLVENQSIADWFDLGSEMAHRLTGRDAEAFVEALTPSKKKSYEYPLKVCLSHGWESLVEQARITVGTIHSVKGAQADVVFLLNELSQAGSKEWATGGRDGIIRQFYVGITRAKECLYVCGPHGGQIQIK